MEGVENLLKTSLSEVERLLNSKTVVGEPIKIDGNTLIPLISLGFGFGAGGGTGKGELSPGKSEGKGEGTGAGVGGGGGIKPVAMIIINKEGVRVEPIKGGTASVFEKFGEAIGKAVEKGTSKKSSD